MNTATIMMVDDKIDQELASVVESLEMEGYTILTASMASEAFGHLREQRIDVILTDYNMPLVNGLDFFYKVRADFPEIPVIMMTGIGDVKVVAAFFKARGFDFIEKPVNLPELEQKIKRALKVGDQRYIQLLQNHLETNRGDAHLAAAKLRTLHSLADKITGNDETVRQMRVILKNLAHDMTAIADRGRFEGLDTGEEV
ncbi:MAG: response regulator [Magnetococcales bacterium]|nr:response regulator [Magnetococcales bacterium]